MHKFLIRRSVYVLLLLGLTGCASFHSNSMPQYYPYRHLSSQQLLQRGQVALNKHHYSKATTYFQAMDALYPFGLDTQQGQLDSIEAYYKDGSFVLALAAADRYTRLYPRDRHADYAYYMKGVIALNMGGTWLQRKFHSDPSLRDPSTLRQALADFLVLQQAYPHSKYSPKAKEQVVQIRGLLAKRLLFIARFYQKKKAYVAVINRCQELISKYPHTDEVKPAKQLMQQASRYLGLAKR